MEKLDLEMRKTNQTRSCVSDTLVNYTSPKKIQVKFAEISEEQDRPRLPRRKHQRRPEMDIDVPIISLEDLPYLTKTKLCRNIVHLHHYLAKIQQEKCMEVPACEHDEQTLCSRPQSHNYRTPYQISIDLYKENFKKDSRRWLHKSSTNPMSRQHGNISRTSKISNDIPNTLYKLHAKKDDRSWLHKSSTKKQQHQHHETSTEIDAYLNRLKAEYEERSQRSKDQHQDFEKENKNICFNEIMSSESHYNTMADGSIFKNFNSNSRTSSVSDVSDMGLSDIDMEYNKAALSYFEATVRAHDISPCDSNTSITGQPDIDDSWCVL